MMPEPFTNEGPIDDTTLDDEIDYGDDGGEDEFCWVCGDDHDEMECDRYDFHPIKWTCDGLTSLTDVATALRGLAEHFQERADAGWHLVQAVDNGFVISILGDPVMPITAIEGESVAVDA